MTKSGVDSRYLIKHSCLLV